MRSVQHVGALVREPRGRLSVTIAKDEQDVNGEARCFSKCIVGVGQLDHAGVLRETTAPRFRFRRRNAETREIPSLQLRPIDCCYSMAMGYTSGVGVVI